MKKLTVVGLSLLLVFGVIQMASAEGWMHREGHRGGWMRGQEGYGKEMLKTLSLTPDQIKQMQTLRLEMEKEMLKPESDMKAKKLELKELMQQATPPADETKVKIREMMSLATPSALLAADYQLKMYDILTPEQRQKIPFFDIGHSGNGMEWH